MPHEAPDRFMIVSIRYSGLSNAKRRPRSGYLCPRYLNCSRVPDIPHTLTSYHRTNFYHVLRCHTHCARSPRDHLDLRRRLYPDEPTSRYVATIEKIPIMSTRIPSLSTFRHPNHFSSCPYLSTLARWRFLTRALKTNITLRSLSLRRAR